MTGPTCPHGATFCAECLVVRLVEIIPADARGIVIHLPDDTDLLNSDSINDMRGDVEKALGIPVIAVTGDVRIEAIT